MKKVKASGFIYTSLFGFSLSFAGLQAQDSSPDALVNFVTPLDKARYESAQERVFSESNAGSVIISERLTMPVSDLATPFTAVVGTKLYLIGGHLGDQHYYHPWNFTAASWVMDFSEKQKSWKRLPDRPTTAMGSNGTGVWNNQIFVFGGFGNNWTEGLYKASSSPRVNSQYWDSSKMVDVFDLATQTWSSISDSGFPARSSAGVVQMGSRVYFVGGWDAQTDEFFTRVSYFELEAKKYVDTEVAVPAPVNRRAVIATAISETEFVMAGGLGVEKELWLFNIQSNEWTRLSDLPFGATNAQIASVNGRLFLLGGHHSDRLGRSILEYDFDASDWVDTDLQLSRRKASGRLVVLGDSSILLLGGYVRNGKDDPFIPSFEGKEFGQSPVSEIEWIQLK